MFPGLSIVTALLNQILSLLASLGVNIGLPNILG
jgi:hypothetical protein